jgi:hypothetical protein
MLRGQPKVAAAPLTHLSQKAGPSASPNEELTAWDFIRVGLAFDLIIAVVILVVSALGRMTVDTIPVGVAVFLLVSVAIWGGVGLVAVPTLVMQRVRRTWAHQCSKRRRKSPRVWDDEIDGPAWVAVVTRPPDPTATAHSPLARPAAGKSVLTTADPEVGDSAW